MIIKFYYFTKKATISLIPISFSPYTIYSPSSTSLFPAPLLLLIARVLNLVKGKNT